MSEEKNWPAFPVDTGIAQYAGMSLRDYFAAKAMQGLMVGVEMPICDYIASKSYEMADAMLEARSEE